MQAAWSNDGSHFGHPPLIPRRLQESRFALVEATVINVYELAAFAAFDVELKTGEVETIRGFIHRSELAWGYVGDARRVVKVRLCLILDMDRFTWSLKSWPWKACTCCSTCAVPSAATVLAQIRSELGWPACGTPGGEGARAAGNAGHWVSPGAKAGGQSPSTGWSLILHSLACADDRQSPVLQVGDTLTAMIVAVQPERGHVALSLKVQDTNKVDELFDASKVDELMSRPPSTGSVDFPEGEGPGSVELQHVSRTASSRACKKGPGLGEQIRGRLPAGLPHVGWFLLRKVPICQNHTMHFPSWAHVFLGD